MEKTGLIKNIKGNNMMNINDVFKPLDFVDLKTLLMVSDRLKKSRNKKEQAIGSFLNRVYLYRSEGSNTTPQSSNSSGKKNKINTFDGLRDLRE